MNCNTPDPHVTLPLDQDVGLRLHRALWRANPPPGGAVFLREWPWALHGSGLAARTCAQLLPTMPPEVRVTGALLATLCEPSTFWPDLDLVAVGYGRLDARADGQQSGHDDHSEVVEES